MLSNNPSTKTKSGDGVAINYVEPKQPETATVWLHERQQKVRIFCFTLYRIIKLILPSVKSKVSEYGSQISADSSQSDHASMGSQAVSASSKLFNRKKTNAAHGKDKPGAGALQQFAIFDEEGNDITPRPMFNRPPAMPRPLDNKDAPKGSRSVLNASTAALSIKRTLQVHHHQ
jgi:hypothetical protein